MLRLCEHILIFVCLNNNNKSSSYLCLHDYNKASKTKSFWILLENRNENAHENGNHKASYEYFFNFTIPLTNTIRLAECTDAKSWAMRAMGFSTKGEVWDGLGDHRKAPGPQAKSGNVAAGTVSLVDSTG